MSLIDPPRWSETDFDEQLSIASTAFRKERIREPVEQYREVFEDYATRIRTLLDVTDNLSRLEAAPERSGAPEVEPEAPQDVATVLEEILGDEVGLEALRYLAGPPISADDLKTSGTRFSGTRPAARRSRDGGQSPRCGAYKPRCQALPLGR